MINRRDFIRSTGLAAFGLSVSRRLGVANGRKKEEALNFLFILVDDLGCRDLGFSGSTFYETPNIDRIARSGMTFRQGYATCQVCSPSRASIMTGKYTPRHGVTDWIGAATGENWNRKDKLLPPAYEHQLPPGDTTLAQALKEGGYTTFFAGKWHLGDEPEEWPEYKGFDMNVGGWSAGSPKGGYFSPYDNPRLENKTPGEYLPYRLATETADFIQAHKDERFLAYLSFYAVHGPIQTTKKLWDKYREKALRGESVEERHAIDRTLPVRQVQDHPVYAGLMEALDDAVGIVLDKLKELGLDERTVVIFTSDNGGVSSGDSYSTSNLPFRGGKGRQWEGGIREPFLISVPGMTEPGGVCDVPVIGTDFYPTLLELAGLPLRPKQHMDGVSLVPLLQGKTIEKRDLYWHYPHYGNQGGEPSSIIRSMDWKLIHYYEDGRDELYDLGSDVGEQHDVAESHPDWVKELRQRLDQWLSETGAKIPEPDPRWKPEFVEQKKQDALRRKDHLERQHKRVLEPDWQPGPNWYGSIPED